MKKENVFLSCSLGNESYQVVRSPVPHGAGTRCSCTLSLRWQ